jgi:hypothetical protein
MEFMSPVDRTAAEMWLVTRWSDKQSYLASRA